MQNIVDVRGPELNLVSGGNQLSGTLGAYAAGAGLAAAVTVEVPPASLACAFVAGTLGLGAALADYLG